MRKLESKLEKGLVAWAKASGGMALKGATQFDTGYPDRVVYLPGAQAHVELKGSSTTYHLNEKQKVWAGRIIASKSPYYIIESEEQLEAFKKNVWSDASRFTVNQYSLNGDNLVMVVNETKRTYEILSHKNGKTSKLLEGIINNTLVNTIYKVFVNLERKYPRTNYADMF